MRTQLAVCILACIAVSCSPERTDALKDAQITADPPLSRSELSEIVQAVRQATADRITSIDRNQIPDGPDVAIVVTISPTGLVGFEFEKRAGVWQIVSRGEMLPLKT